MERTITEQAPCDGDPGTDLKRLATSMPESAVAVRAVLAKLEVESARLQQEHSAYEMKSRLAKEIAEKHRSAEHVPTWLVVAILSLLFAAIAYVFVKHSA